MTLQEILKETCLHRGQLESEVTSKIRSGDVLYCRQEVYRRAIIYKHKLSAIARFFRAYHTTVKHGSERAQLHPGL